MNKLNLLSWLLASASWLVFASAEAAQSVNPVVPILFADSQAALPVDLMYTLTTPDTDNSTGLGLRIHYNSNALDLISQTPYSNQLQPMGAMSYDTQNLDSDPNTDKYWVLAWVDINAAWPGTGKTPLNLLSSQFRTKANFSGVTTIRLSAAATAKNTNFQASPLVICAKPSIALTASDALANEQATNPASFQVSIANALPTECGNLSIHYQVSGTATAGSDYTTLSGTVVIPLGSQHASILLTPLVDSQTEVDESVILTLQASNNYQLTSDLQASATIQDASTNVVLPTVVLTSAKLQVLEGTDNTVNLSLARQSSDLSKALTVYLQATGSATVSSDYQILPSTIVIPAGQTKATLALNIINDTLQEQNETLKISLQANTAYQLSDLNAVDLVLLDDELRTNTDLPLDQLKPQTIPTLSENRLLFLSACFVLLVVTHSRLRQRLKQGAS